MKTPREILFERHRQVEPALDAVRRKALATLPARPQNRGLDTVSSCRRVLGQVATGALAVLRKGWLELIWPSRRAWVGLTAIWLAVFGANLQMKTPSQPAPAVQFAPRILAQALQERLRVLAELLPPSTPRPTAMTHPKAGPRSERPTILKTC